MLPDYSVNHVPGLYLAGLTMLAAAERTGLQRSTQHRSVRSQQKPALRL